MSKPTVFTFRLEIERWARKLSPTALAEAVSSRDLPVTPKTIEDMLCRRPETVGHERRADLLRRIAWYFGMPESEAWRLQQRVDHAEAMALKENKQ